jgi:hypothetical protein
LRAAAFIVVVTACGGAAAGGGVGHPAASRAELDRFLADEERALTLLAAADPRIAARGVTADETALHHATMSAILAEDATLAMEGDRPDVLSFEVRARALDMASEIVTHWKVPPSDPDPTSAMRPALEVELLGRLISSEKLRLASERDVPRSAGILLGGLAATWRTPALKEIDPRDGWLSRRLAEVTQSVTPQSLTVLERDALDDALDPLERVVADVLPKSRAALVALRVATSAMDPAARSPDRWSTLAPRLHADAGTMLSSDTLLAFFAVEAKSLRAEISQLVVGVTDDRADRVGEALAAGAPAPCNTVSVGSRVRSLEPAPERAFDCALRSSVIAAHTAEENLDVLITMHDAVVAAAWAVILARGGGPETIALGAPKPIAPMSPTLEGKLMRFAATHPVEAIDRALSIAWIMRSGLAEAALRADAWKTFGDAPLDVIERELHPEPREKTHLVQSSTSTDPPQAGRREQEPSTDPPQAGRRKPGP